VQIACEARRHTSRCSAAVPAAVVALTRWLAGVPPGDMDRSQDPLLSQRG
jgi:hypothetical protein